MREIRMSPIWVIYKGILLARSNGGYTYGVQAGSEKDCFPSKCGYRK